MDNSSATNGKKRQPYPFSIAAILGEDFNKDAKQDGYEQKSDTLMRQDTAQHVKATSHNNSYKDTAFSDSPMRFEWLDCTRYNPPKVPSK